MKKPIYVYLICHNRTDIKTLTYIGAAYDFRHRLDQHNGRIKGGPRITRKAAGCWEPVLVLEMGADRTYSSKLLKKDWKNNSRGLESRIRKGFELALKHKLRCFIMQNPNIKNGSILTKLESKWKDGRILLSTEEMSTLIAVPV